MALSRCGGIKTSGHQMPHISISDENQKKKSIGFCWVTHTDAPALQRGSGPAPRL
jgi:hypothetical protein